MLKLQSAGRKRRRHESHEGWRYKDGKWCFLNRLEQAVAARRTTRRILAGAEEKLLRLPMPAAAHTLANGGAQTAEPRSDKDAGLLLRPLLPLKQVLRDTARDSFVLNGELYDARAEVEEEDEQQGTGSASSIIAPGPSSEDADDGWAQWCELVRRKPLIHALHQAIQRFSRSEGASESSSENNRESMNVGRLVLQSASRTISGGNN